MRGVSNKHCLLPFFHSELSMNSFQASEICNDTGDRAACYHLARQLENQDHIKEAIHFFQRAEAYGNAIRLCKVCSSLIILRLLIDNFAYFSIKTYVVGTH